MEASATVTSRGQVTMPASVRQALGIRRGSRLLFQIENEELVMEEPASGRRVMVTRFPDFFDLAGSVPVPAGLRGASSGAIRRRAREQRAAAVLGSGRPPSVK